MRAASWWTIGAGSLLVACVPALPHGQAAVDATPPSPEQQATLASDPRTDPNVFDVEKPTEADARRLAEKRCGLEYELVAKRSVSRTGGTVCGTGMLAHALTQHQTTKSHASAETCTPGATSRETVYRFRCWGAITAR